MRRSVRFQRQSQAEFYREFSLLCNTHTDWEAWSDFVFMSAVAISNALNSSGETHDERERQYMETIQRYSQEEREIFPRLLAVVVGALDDEPDQDFLGEMFSALELNSHWKGQFFTPYHVGHFMACIMLDDIEKEIEHRGWACINDPCCGAGALLVAARNVMVQRKIPSTGVLFVAQDIDRTAALMCYIQLALLGCAGYVIVADSLRYPPTGHPLASSKAPEQDIWYLPMYYHTVWQQRILCYSIGAILRHHSGEQQNSNTIPTSGPAHPPIQSEQYVGKLNITQSGQLSLF